MFFFLPVVTSATAPDRHILRLEDPRSNVGCSVNHSGVDDLSDFGSFPLKQGHDYPHGTHQATSGKVGQHVLWWYRCQLIPAQQGQKAAYRHVVDVVAGH